MIVSLSLIDVVCLLADCLFVPHIFYLSDCLCSAVVSVDELEIYLYSTLSHE